MAQGSEALTLRVAVWNGPNLNLLGQREPALYGHHTLADIETMVREEAARLDVALSWSQSNHEGVLVDAIQRCPPGPAPHLNAAAYLTPARHPGRPPARFHSSKFTCRSRSPVRNSATTPPRDLAIG
jgi:hypothetical protein